MVRRKWTGNSTTRRRLHHRRLDFEVVLRVEECPNVRDDRRTRPEDLAARLVHDQVHIALPVTRLHVRQSVEFFGQWSQGLGEQSNLVRPHSQLTRFGPKQHADCGNYVANIPLLEALVDTLRQAVTFQPDLDLSRPILQLDKARLAHDALHHHAANH